MFATLLFIPLCMSQRFHNEKEISHQNGLFMFSKSWGKSLPTVFPVLWGDVLSRVAAQLLRKQWVRSGPDLSLEEGESPSATVLMNIAIIKVKGPFFLLVQNFRSGYSNIPTFEGRRERTYSG